MASRRTFIVVDGTSVRQQPEPACTDEIHFAPGDTVVEGSYPKHTPVDEWLASGHWRQQPTKKRS